MSTDNVVQSTEPPVEVAGAVGEATVQLAPFSFPEYQSVLSKKKDEPMFTPLTDEEIKGFSVAKLREYLVKYRDLIVSVRRDLIATSQRIDIMSEQLRLQTEIAKLSELKAEKMSQSMQKNGI